MMWAKRLLAGVVAAGLIVAAVLVRGEIRDEGDGGPDDASLTTLVCLTELKQLCDTVAAEHPGLSVRVASAARTATDWTQAERPPTEAWLTVAPFPELVGDERARARLAPIDVTTDAIGASQLVIAVPNAKAPTLATECGDALDWRCIGATSGTAWAELGGPAGSVVRPAFAPLESAVGQLGVTQAMLGYFADAPFDAGDAGLITWVRRLARAVSPTALSGGTPIGTVQVRDSALDVAVGFDAEITNAGRDRLTVLYAAPMTRVDLVLAAPAGVSVPAAVRATLASSAREFGWAATATGEPLTAAQVVQATGLWRQLT